VPASTEYVTAPWLKPSASGGPIEPADVSVLPAVSPNVTLPHAKNLGGR
jgi:hypothetical protein